MDTEISDNDVTYDSVDEFTDETLFVETKSGRAAGSWHCSYLKSKYFILKPLKGHSSILPTKTIFILMLFSNICFSV